MIDLVVVVLLLAFLTWYGHREPSENKTVQLAKPDRNDNHVKPVIEPTSAQTKNDTNTSEDISDVQNIDQVWSWSLRIFLLTNEVPCRRTDFLPLISVCSYISKVYGMVW